MVSEGGVDAPGTSYPKQRRLAALETSFCVVACRAEVAATCLDYLDVVVPRGVEAEIVAPQAASPGASILTLLSSASCALVCSMRPPMHPEVTAHRLLTLEGQEN